MSSLFLRRCFCSIVVLSALQCVASAQTPASDAARGQNRNLNDADKKALNAAVQASRRKKMTQVGTAFHYYHDALSHFPGAGRSADGEGGRKSQAGLSWRVHLLPFLDEAPLFGKFNLDEPWDSEQNKKLIDEMPEIFKSAAVTESGKTSYHVFTGKGSLFEKDRTPRLGDITDGVKNTILVVEAGADTASIWTKPGGLDFDPKNPIEALGKLEGDSFLALMCDGAIHAVMPMIEPASLRRMIQHQDGETINK